MWVTIEGMAKLRKLDTFGGRLRMAREDAGLNQEQLTALLAERYGVTIGRSYISELERSWEANKMPMADVLAAIASALNVNGNWLLLLDDNPDLPEPDAGHGVSVEAQEIANLVDALPPWRRRELLVWLHYVLDVGEELQSETRQTAEEIRLRLAAAQRGSRRDRLQEIATHGPAMLATPDTAAANTWLRQYVRVFVAKNRVIEVRFL